MSIKTTVLCNFKNFMAKWFTTTDEMNRKFSEINTKLDSLVGFSAVMVEELPKEGKDGIIYLILSEEGEDKNIYDEYIWFNNDFEKIGDTNVGVDMSAYALASDVNTALEGKADKVHVHEVATTTENGFMSAEDKARLENLASGENAYVLPVASSTELGGVKVGSNLTIDKDGTLKGGYPEVTYDPDGRTGVVSSGTLWSLYQHLNQCESDIMSLNSVLEFNGSNSFRLDNLENSFAVDDLWAEIERIWEHIMTH